MTIEEPVMDRFLEYLTLEKGRAPLTIEAYRSDLVQLSEFLGTRQLVAARHRDIGDYVAKASIGDAGSFGSAPRFQFFANFSDFS